MLRCVCLSLLLCALPALAADEPGPARDVAELKPLAHFVGQWTSEGTVKSGDQPAYSLKGTTTAEWIHDGRFVRQSWSIEAVKEQPAMTGSSIMTYDTDKKAYRNWLFLSSGHTSEATGTWDAASRTFTWTAKHPDGATTTTKASFPEDGVQKWSITTTAPDGKVVYEMVGLNKRRKG